MTTRFFGLTAVCSLMIVVDASIAFTGDWPHWRGPLRNGHSSEPSGWRNGSWLAPKPLWTTNVGAGSSSPIVLDGRLYVLGWADGKDTLHCLDAETGKEAWRVSYASREYGRHAVGDEGFYSGPCSTPELDPATGLLYSLGIDGDLNCFDTRNKGRKVWGFNLYDRYQVARRPKLTRAPQRDYGYTASPVVHGDWVLVEVGARAGNLIAFDKKTGEQRWTSACDDPAGHNAGPAPITVEGVPCLAILTQRRLVVVRLDAGHEGKLIAEHPWVTDFANNIAAPAVQDDCVLITSHYNHQAICKLRITLAGAKKLWEQPVASKVCTPVVHKGRVYFAWQKLHCLDWATGAQRWQGGSYGDAGSCVVTADDRLVVWGGRGLLTLVESAERSPERYTELARREGLSREHAWPHVVLSGQRVYCKDRRGRITCLELQR